MNECPIHVFNPSGDLSLFHDEHLFHESRNIQFPITIRRQFLVVAFVAECLLADISQTILAVLIFIEIIVQKYPDCIAGHLHSAREDIISNQRVFQFHPVHGHCIISRIQRMAGIGRERFSLPRPWRIHIAGIIQSELQGSDHGLNSWILLISDNINGYGYSGGFITAKIDERTGIPGFCHIFDTFYSADLDHIQVLCFHQIIGIYSSTPESVTIISDI